MSASLRELSSLSLDKVECAPSEPYPVLRDDFKRDVGPFDPDDITPLLRLRVDGDDQFCRGVEALEASSPVCESPP